jgi:hypothetical protein
MDEILQDNSKGVAAIRRIDGVPTLLAVLRETTGMLPKALLPACIAGDDPARNFYPRRWPCWGAWRLTCGG